MPKANRTCYCCGHEYYYCPSCPGDKRDPQIYTIWDSEICKDIFDTLVSESTKKITTKECKEKLIELGINKVDIKRETVKNHIDRVMSFVDKNEEEQLIKKEDNVESIEDTKIENELKSKITEKTVEESKKTYVNKRKSSYKNKDI